MISRNTLLKIFPYGGGETVSPAFLAAGLCCGAFISLGWLGEKGSLDSNTMILTLHTKPFLVNVSSFALCS